jgi:dolichol-phosphate mannosyltransferase
LYKGNKVAVIIPCYKVSSQIVATLRNVPSYVDRIYVVDDACPEKTGKFVAKSFSTNKKIEVIFNLHNLGVGGSVKIGYEKALSDNVDIFVKFDGDGQMNGQDISLLLDPIIANKATYTKGNRFHNLEGIRDMPAIRVFGNAVLSFFAKFSTGYWRIFDPNNGFTAISRKALQKIPLDKVHSRYFFESDMLFRLGCNLEIVADIPMAAIYAEEKSNLSIFKTIFEFPFLHFKNFFKRYVYCYLLRDTNLASIELPLGVTFMSYGAVRGYEMWRNSTDTGVPSTAGTVMLSTVFLIFGLQLILSFLNFDSSKENSIQYLDAFD